MMKERDSNFELLRIVAMMLVMLVHANYYSLGDVTRSEIMAAPWTGFVRVFCEQLCIVSVNLFVLLSGWFGIRPTLKKFTALIFQILFIGLISVEACRYFGVEVSSRSLSDMLYLGASYWFVPSYLILFCIAPVLNSYCEHTAKREFAALLVGYFVLEALFGWLTYDYGNFMKGYSALSFIGLYLLAQYVRRHGDSLRAMKWWQHLLFYLLFTAIPATISYVGLYLKNKSYGATSYSSLLVIAASLFLMLIFSKFSFKSKIVNWVSSSAFAIYLLHQAPGVSDLYRTMFAEAYESMHGGLFFLFVLGAVAAIALAAIVLDKLRLLVWNGVLRVKQLVVK